MKALFKRVSTWQPLKDFINFYKSSELSLSSIAVAYYLLLSIFPLLLILANLLPFLNLDTDLILDVLQDQVPPQIYEMSVGFIRNILENPSTGLLSVSVLAGFWTFSRALATLQMAINKAYEVSQHRDFILSRIIGLVVGLGLMILLSLTILISTFGQVTLTFIHDHIFAFDNSLYRTLQTATLPVVIVVVFVSLILLYFVLPNVKIHKLRYIMPGTIFSTLVFVALPNFFGVYLGRALSQMRDFKLVGSLLIFGLMIWFIFIAKVLIIGAVLNATYQKKYFGQIETRRGEIVGFIKDIRK
ncbi:YihY/virulence factor BrkB family protein [Lactococcus garvieae]|uniref:Ribonuclease BN n=1 Tax=Lactococcus garvieae DCC43 TaxID=1231377 RepID=K2PKA6_9LACT|nr:YihY/virulence factor BrkB family protein [Lactococcus garvieae]EKF50599.1 Ribonuclease BN [Lactococcus garvieae DCC43]